MHGRSMYEIAQRLRQHLLTGVSYAIPFIACGGILIAAAIAFAPMTPKGPDFSQSPALQLISNIGTSSFALMLPVLAGYIAYSAAGKPALAPGFIGGYLSGQIKAGFLGAILAAATCAQVPYDNVRGADFFQLDARFGRLFTFKEKFKLDLYFQAFDLTNRANFGTSYGTNIRSSTFEMPTNFIAASSAIIPKSFSGEFGARFSF